MRLLTAVAYRCAEVTDSETFKDAASRDRLFDPEAVDAYFGKHSNEFWLLPPEGSGHRPFYQDPSLVAPEDPNLEPLKPKPISRSELSMDITPSYMWGQQHPDPAFTPAAAARAMLVFLSYSRSGGGAHHPELKGRQTVFKAGKLRTKVSLHPVGASLEDTLRLHLIDPDAVDGLLSGGVGQPSWELPPAVITQPLSAPKSLLEVLTGRWEKTVLLVPSVDGTVVREALGASGRLRNDAIPEHDPYAVRWDNSDDKTDAPYVYLKGSIEKAPWRDLDNYRAGRDDSGNQTIVTRYHHDHPAAARVRVWVTVSHQQGTQVAKDVLKLVSLIPASSIVHPDAGDRAALFIKDAEQIGRCLRGTLQGFYRDIGHPSAKGIRDAFTEGIDDKNLNSATFAKRHMPTYWDRMERLFTGTVTEDHRRSEIIDAARDVFDSAARSFGQRLAMHRRGADGADDRGPEPLAVTAARWRGCIKFPKPKKD